MAAIPIHAGEIINDVTPTHTVFLSLTSLYQVAFQLYRFQMFPFPIHLNSLIANILGSNFNHAPQLLSSNQNNLPSNMSSRQDELLDIAAQAEQDLNSHRAKVGVQEGTGFGGKDWRPASDSSTWPVSNPFPPLWPSSTPKKMPFVTVGLPHDMTRCTDAFHPPLRLFSPGIRH